MPHQPGISQEKRVTMIWNLKTRSRGAANEPKSSKVRRVGAGMTGLGLALAATAIFLPTTHASATAKAASNGQDGTVKIEVLGSGVDTPSSNKDNDPHVDCSFQIVYTGVTTHAGGSVNV